MEYRTEQRNGQTVHIRHFSSVTEQVAALATPNAKNRALHAQHMANEDGQDWFGVASLRQVETAVRDGWQAGTERMLDAMGKFSGEFQAVSIKRRLVRGDHGDELDIHRVIRGELDKAWTRRHRATRAASSIVTLACDLMMLGNISPEELFWRGAAVVRLSDILTEAGYAVEIVGYANSKGINKQKTHGDCQIVTVKAPDMPLDLNAVTSVLCLAGYFRHYILGARCALPVQIRDGYGYSDYSAKFEWDTPHLIRANGAQIRTREQAEAWLSGRIAEFEAKQEQA